LESDHEPEWLLTVGLGDAGFRPQCSIIFGLHLALPQST